MYVGVSGMFADGEREVRGERKVRWLSNSLLWYTGTIKFDRAGNHIDCKVCLDREYSVHITCLSDTWYDARGPEGGWLKFRCQDTGIDSLLRAAISIVLIGQNNIVSIDRVYPADDAYYYTSDHLF